MRLANFLRKIRRSFLRFEPSVEIFISRKRLVGNLNEYKKKYPKLLFAPVLKSNAYGHGIVEVAEILDKENIAFFALDSLAEAMILRSNGIKSEILIIGHVKPENIEKFRLSKVAFTITSFEQLQGLSRIISGKLNIHLKLDTGMHRQGISLEQISKSIEIIKSNKFLNLLGLCSHFADADGDSEAFTKLQMKQWEEIVLRFQKEFSTIKYLHIAGTAGTFFNQENFGNLVRLGIGLYGVNASPHARLNLKPVLRMQSVLSSVGDLLAGEHVGYNITYQAKGDMKIATVPVGYFEGVDRRLSNCGFFKIGNVFCTIIGRVSMNISSIDVSALVNPKFGDKVLIISDDANDKNSVENIAKLAQSIPWEIFVHIPQHLRRTVV